jgi:hypothetical protein
MSVISTGTSNGLFVKDLDDVLGIGATINSAGAFTASTGPTIGRTDIAPNGVVSARSASLLLDVSNGQLLVNTTPGDTTGTTWGTVGGPAAKSVVESAAVNAAVLTTFGGASVTLPADTLRVGSRIRFNAYVRVSAVSGGGATANVTAQFGGTTIFTTLARGVADEDIISVDGYVDIRTSGNLASGTCSGVLMSYISANNVLTSAAGAEWSQTFAGAGTPAVLAIDTTVANIFNLVGATDAAGTALNLENFRLYVDV